MDPADDSPDAAWRPGHLMLVGGHEDRSDEMQVLKQFVRLCGGADSTIVVLTAASSRPDALWQLYDRAFGELGVRSRFPLAIAARTDADDPARVEMILAADGVFVTGGDQKRLMAVIGGTGVASALHRAFRERRACIGGTSAGAAAMSRHMLAWGSRDVLPGKHAGHLAEGLGFLQRAVIDQHFSERRRLARLLSVVAENPHLVGVGIDEDTALLIEGGRRLEVIGKGAVTLLDGRRTTSTVVAARGKEHLQLIGTTLHLLPTGTCWQIPVPGQTLSEGDASQVLREILGLVVCGCEAA